LKATLKPKRRKIKLLFKQCPPKTSQNFMRKRAKKYINKKAGNRNYLSRVVFSAAISDSSRPALSGVLLDKDKTRSCWLQLMDIAVIQKNVFKTKEELKKPL